ncbi:MAG: DNA polymerase III subunit delta [Puniceicoccaceae bacterium]
MTAAPQPTATFRFVAGDDDFVVDRFAKRYFTEASSTVDDSMAIEVIDGRAQTVDEVERAITQLTSAVRTLSLFGDRKVVWLRQINFLGEGRTATAEGTRLQVELLKTLLEGINPQDVTLILSASPFDKRRSFAKWVQKAPGYEETPSASKGNAFEEIISEAAQAEGKKILPEALLLLRMKLNGDIRMATSEIAKLSLSLDPGESTITPEQVLDLVPEFGESEFFEAAEAFYTLRLEPAIAALRRYFFTHKEGRPLLTVLLNRNRLLILLKSVIDSGELLRGPRGIDKKSLEKCALAYRDRFGDPSEKDSINIFAQNPYYLNRLIGPLDRLNLRQLVTFQQNFVECFWESLDRPREQEEVFVNCFTRCLEA